jgi:hypothetical protein
MGRIMTIALRHTVIEKYHWMLKIHDFCGGKLGLRRNHDNMIQESKCGAV